jgi:non-homologous end joining protein Ku
MSNFSDDLIRIISYDGSFKVVCIEPVEVSNYLLATKTQLKVGDYFDAMSIPSVITENEHFLRPNEKHPERYLIKTDVDWIRIEKKYFKTLEEFRDNKLEEIGI